MSRYRFLLRHCVHVVVVQSSYRFAVRQLIPAVVVDCVYVTVQNHVCGKRQIVSRHHVFPLLVTYCLLYLKNKTVQVNLQLKIFKTVFTCSSPNLRNCKFDLTFAACLYNVTLNLPTTLVVLCEIFVTVSYQSSFLTDVA